MKELKKLMAALNAACKAGDALDEAWELDPENKEIEQKWNDAYTKEYECRRSLARAITSITAQIDYDTAYKMTFDPKLANLINRLA